MAALRRPLLALALCAFALSAGLGFVASPRQPAREATAALVAVLAAPSAALADKSPGDILTDKASDGAFGIAGLTWNAVFIGSAVAAGGLILAPVLAVPLLSAPATTADLKGSVSKPQAAPESSGGFKLPFF